MSVSDRAFIKAYARDQAEPQPPAPHMPLSAEVAHRSSWASEDPYGSDTALAANRVVASAAAPAPAINELRPSGSYVPAPHFALSQESPQGRKLRQRTRLQVAPPLGEVQTSARPLSAFVETPPVRESLEPKLEVAAFAWPERCEQLLDQADPQLDEMAERLAGVTPQKLLAITGLYRGEGRTSLLLALARKLAGRNIRTAIVDADWQRPTLAGALGLAVNEGWEDVLVGRLALAETLIYSQQDRLTLLPLSQPPADVRRLMGCVQLPVSLAQLQENYDLVLVDAGPVLAAGATVVDLLGRCPGAAALVVRDCRAIVEQELAQAAQAIVAAGATVLGVVENFAAPILRKSRTEAALSAAAM